MQDSVFIFITAITVLFILIVVAFYLTTIDRKKVLNAKFIEAKWKRQGVAPSTGEKWSFSYEFNKGKVKLQGANPNFNATANYQIIREKESFVALQLSNLQGDFLKENTFKPQVLKLGVDKKNNELYIDGRLYKKA